MKMRKGKTQKNLPIIIGISGKGNCQPISSSDKRNWEESTNKQ
jgi:hypothetical protein